MRDEWYGHRFEDHPKLSRWYCVFQVEDIETRKKTADTERWNNGNKVGLEIET